MMSTRITLLLIISLLAGCTSSHGKKMLERSSENAGYLEKVETTADATSTAATFEGYKRDLAQRISQVNSTKVYAGRPQALLRSIVVLKYSIDAQGKLLRSEILRSNRDRATESTALASLKSTAPFPKPASYLLRHGRVDITESWLFNNDGRFQLRSIAEPQLNE